MTADLSGVVGVVTGGNGGIGLGLARGLARAGASVAIWGRNEDKNRAAAEELSALGAEVLALQCDVTDEARVAQAVDETVSRFGRIDACFANAGAAAMAPSLLDTTVEAWNQVMAVNLTGVFLTFREVVRHMVAREGGGSLVATSSIGADFGMPNAPHYSASKAALGGLVRSVAVGYGPKGIRANLLLPGFIETGMTQPLRHDERFARGVARQTPARRWGTPADFEAIAVYLASPGSRFHSGDTLRVDGGYSVM